MPLKLNKEQKAAAEFSDGICVVVAVPGGHSRQHEFPGARFIADSLTDPRIFTLL